MQSPLSTKSMTGNRCVADMYSRPTICAVAVLVEAENTVGMCDSAFNTPCRWLLLLVASEANGVCLIDGVGSNPAG